MLTRWKKCQTLINTSTCCRWKYLSKGRSRENTNEQPSDYEWCACLLFHHSLKVNDFSHFKARKLWKSFHSSQSRPPRHHAYVSLGVDHAPFGQRPHVLVLWYQFSSGFPTIAAMGEFGIRLSQPRVKQSSNLNLGLFSSSSIWELRDSGHLF